jgi:acetoin utilization deacetylase AcuC-like enzyme
VMTQKSAMAFALVRPPGHHATRDRGMGFCLINHIAVAARYAQQRYGIQRILIVDIDVHHGNGTQDIFYADHSVFYFSAHQHPLYPGSGRPGETGTGPGLGYTMNVDVSPGSNESRLLQGMLEGGYVPANNANAVESIIRTLVTPP